MSEATTLHEQIDYQSNLLKKLKIRSFKEKRQQLANRVGKNRCNFIMAIIILLMLPFLPLFAFSSFIRKTFDLIKVAFSSYD